MTMTPCGAIAAARPSWRRTLTRSARTMGARRNMAVYTMGDGWTGALGTGRLDTRIRAGHRDTEFLLDLPHKIYNGPVHAARPGWGHTVVLTHDEKLLLTGRPHDFLTLLRMHRLPIPNALKHFISHGAATSPYHPTQLLGRLLSYLVKNYPRQGSARHDGLIRGWEMADQVSLLMQLTEMAWQHDEEHQRNGWWAGDPPVDLACSAGLTALLSSEGRLYTFGLNTYGQCGVGALSSHVFHPTRVMLGVDEEEEPPDRVKQARLEAGPVPLGLVEWNGYQADDDADKSPRIVGVALGLQHGVCVDEHGMVYCWGKGERGQLGQGTMMPQAPVALMVEECFELAASASVKNTLVPGKPLFRPMPLVQQVDAGMLHTAALTVEGEVLLWGKHVLPPSSAAAKKGKRASDARLPCVLTPGAGLPAGKRVVRIACGSHHTALLMDDGSVYGMGLAADSKAPLLYHPDVSPNALVELIPPGVLDLPVRFFGAHHDRTTVVGADGRQVLQVHLFEDKELRPHALFTPPWVDAFLEALPSTRIESIHRGWLHTVVVTEEVDDDIAREAKIDE